ncbi:LPXTG cell wall anchor domain-containing protein [Streptomyces pseudovenezuelae]|uniref:LPXTG cell wall anchor domain-containing protein n=1 Tax=Streptomyces pseudovenezuelae TaxID=67350 RepID=UPI002E8003CB|nr:LPXTG cell wall anchor domain-containing protein [Streptomyces pseudovenezuelae]WUA94146.1 LPXTG cell wall anchor domain-containing protein [Streptomyces pseudovenezuelae]
MLTATAAGTLLGALWFVPSANATQDSPARTEPSAQATTQARVTTTNAETSTDDTRLADTGSFDTTPYVVGGTLFLTLGAGFVVYSVRRERLGF